MCFEKGGDIVAFSDWLIIGGAALLIKHGLKKSNADQGYDEWIGSSIVEDYKKHEEEWNRRLTINSKRRHTPCRFEDGLSYSDFELMAKAAGDSFKRIKKVHTDGPIICCEVESQTGYSSWYFKIDFNDWGHITGTYWTQTENYDSNIPGHYGDVVSELINDYLHRNRIIHIDYSGIVDADPDIGTEKALKRSQSILSRIVNAKNTISIHYSTVDLIGEHLYFVLACLRRDGFQDFQVNPIKDVDVRQEHYIEEVKNVSIQGQDSFRFGELYSSNSSLRSSPSI